MQGLVTAADGSITIPLRHAAPDGDDAKNWLPTPAGPFYLVLRLYQPRAEVLQRRLSSARANSWGCCRESCAALEGPFS